jgi:hypothetical protein
LAKPKPYNCKSAITLTEQILAELRFFVPDQGWKDPVIPWVWKRGRNPLVVVVGDNAGGKSFFRRCVQGACSHSDVECIGISMEARGQGGFVRACVYGTEEWQATGENSAGTVLTGIKTCRGREKPHTIFWDEPDLGLSDSWAAGMGQTIAEFAQDPPEHTRAIFVVSHSKALIWELLPAKPHYLHLGSVEAPPNLTAWLEQPVKPRDLTQLKEASHQRFKRIQRILNENKRDRGSS